MELTIPIYLDTNTLLDMLATVEDGFKTVEKVTTKGASSTNAEGNAKVDGGTEFGIPNVLSLLKINLGVSASLKKGSEKSEERTSERYHTYGSLFNRLRSYLDDNATVTRLDGQKGQWDSIKPSDFVEIHGIFRPNPLANNLEVLEKVFKLGQLMNLIPSSGPVNDSSKGRQSSRSSPPPEHQILAFLQGVLGDIQAERLRAFVIDLPQPVGGKVVTYLSLEYLRDKTLIEISHKEYRLLGKVARKLTQNSSESIDLLINTGLGGIGKETIGNIVNQLSSVPGMSLPRPEVGIAGPALEVVPIAVFV